MSTDKHWHQDPPNAVQIEATEGCTLACTFCAIRSIRTGPKSLFKYMTLDTAHSIAVQLGEAATWHGWNPRIEFAMHGEPSANPDLPDIVAEIRKYNPQAQIMVTTNGTPLANHKDGFNAAVDALFDAGVNVIALDDYRTVKVADEHARLYQRKGVVVADYPANKHYSPHRRYRPSERVLVIVEDIEKAVEGNHATLGNHAGGAGPKDFVLDGKRCAKPFRELSIRWDGNVACCCNDWRGEFKVGNVVTDGLLNVWHHPAMYALRRKLYHGQRDHGPCHGCSHASYRVGLLPDRMGKLDPPEADEEDVKLIEMALAGEPYTTPVLRSWELPDGDPRKAKPEPAVVGGKVQILRG